MESCSFLSLTVFYSLSGSYWSERQLGPIDSPGSGRLYEDSSLSGGLGVFNSTELLLVQSQNDPLSQHSSRIAQELIELGLQFHHVVRYDSFHNIECLPLV